MANKIHSFHKHLSNVYYVSSMSESAGHRGVTKIKTNNSLEFLVQRGKIKDNLKN